MTSVETWGIDWGTEKGKRAAVKLLWEGDRCEVAKVHAHRADPLTWEATLEVTRSGLPVAVDVPFGWPSEFRRFLHAHAEGPDSSLPSADLEVRRWRTNDAARRRTEQVVAAIPGVSPRSGAFDRLGATAASWAVVEAELRRRHVAIDRSGASGTIIETYPAATRRRLGLSSHGVVPEELPGLELRESAAIFERDPHACDALVAALAARAHSLGLTDGPEPADEEIARVEGWIRVPREGVEWADLLAGGGRAGSGSQSDPSAL